MNGRVRKICRGFSFVIIGVCLALSLGMARSGYAQTLEAPVPSGETLFASFRMRFSGLETRDVFITRRGIYSQEKTLFKYLRKLWDAPQEIYDVSLKFDSTQFAEKLFILLTNGYVYEVQLYPTDDGVGLAEAKLIATLTSDNTLGQWNKLWGDDLYMINAMGVVFATHDNTHWSVDTVGLSGAYAYGGVLDTSFNVYLATSKGLFKQGPSATSWQSVSGAGKSLSNIFRLDNEVFYVTGYNGLYFSTDRGATWHADTVGLPIHPSSSLAQGNDGSLYTIIKGYQSTENLYMRKQGSASWKKITGPLKEVGADPLVYYLNSVIADSAIRVSTNFGLYISSDEGAHWEAITRGLTANNIYSYWIQPNGRRLMSTNLGIFTREATDTSWTKRFPETQFYPNAPIIPTRNGNLYTYGIAKVEPNFVRHPQQFYFSTDNGTTWAIDTAGFYQFETSAIPFVDEEGNEYLATVESPHPHLYVKHPGGAWMGDTNGIVYSNSDQPGSYFSDRHGFIYFTMSGNHLYRRAINGSTWQDVPLSPQVGVPAAMTAMKDGKIVAAGLRTTMGMFDGTSWTPVQPPPFVAGTVFLLATDSNNTLYAGFGDFDMFFRYVPTGVYATTDLGVNWKQVEGGFISFKSLIGIGDSMYGLSSNGAYPAKIP